MDVWSAQQLRRMQLGGTARFAAFLRHYPQLREPPRTVAELSARYTSRAAAYYRLLLHAQCEGGDGAELEEPWPSEGHLPMEDASGQTSAGAPPRPASADADEGEQAVRSLEEEQAALEVAFQVQQQRFDLPLDLPASPSTSAPRPSELQDSAGCPAPASTEIAAHGAPPAVAADPVAAAAGARGAEASGHGDLQESVPLRPLQRQMDNDGADVLSKGAPDERPPGAGEQPANEATFPLERLGQQVAAEAASQPVQAPVVAPPPAATQDASEASALSGTVPGDRGSGIGGAGHPPDAQAAGQQCQRGDEAYEGAEAVFG